MSGVSAWFAERGEIPLVVPFRLREYAPLSDDPDRPASEFPSEAICGAAFTIEYCDSRGWVSTRTIRCERMDPQPPATIQAFCHVRGTSRTFRLDRIISIVGLRNGAILSGEAHVQLLAPYLRGARSDPQTQALCRLQDAARDGVFALLQIAMPDGHLSDGARAIVLDYVVAEAGSTGCPLPPIAAVELWVDNLAPPLAAVTAAVERLLTDKAKLVRLLPWLLKIARDGDGAASQEPSLRELIEAIRTHYRRKPMEVSAQIRALA
jgi:hypothetical protein